MWFVRSKPGAPEAPLVVVPLTSEQGAAGQPSSRPTGTRWLLLESPRDRGTTTPLNVKIIGVAGDPRRLTNGYHLAATKGQLPAMGSVSVFVRGMGGDYEIWKIETPVGGRGAVRKDKLISTIYSDEDPSYFPRWQADCI